MKKLILVLASLNAFAGGPFSPPASVTGTTAISKDSPMITSWAVNGYVEFSGYLNIENKQLGFVSFGDIENTFGYSNGSTWSLGDSGVVVLEFSDYISDNEGFDFAVFENSFSETFLELAFVEVSSDGINFFRFPSTSLTDSSSNVGTFGNLDATNLNNLAGKYSAGYGTPFDLAELPDTSLLNKQAIQYVKIIDPVLAKGNVEEWLKPVEEVKIKSVKDVIDKANLDYTKQGQEREKWVTIWPGQAVLAVSMMKWTSQAEEAMKKSGISGLEVFYQKQQQQLQGIVGVVRTPISRL